MAFMSLLVVVGAFLSSNLPQEIRLINVILPPQEMRLAANELGSITGRVDVEAILIVLQLMMAKSM